MNKKTTHSILFSPTGTTRTTLQAVSNGTGRMAGKTLDITLSGTSETISFLQEDLVVVGMPVYGGRLPSLAVERFKSIKGSDTPVIPIVIYGNRAYGDALVELCDLCEAQGFYTVAAGAFLGEHSFSSAEFPIASGRPDQKDLEQAEEFGRQIGQLLDKCGSDVRLDLETVQGNRPYKPEMQPTGAATETDLAECTHCGACAAHCPAQCIRMEDGIPKTTVENCIWCIACIQHCPTKARKIILPKIHEIAQRLHADCQTRREPEIFQPLEK